MGFDPVGTTGLLYALSVGSAVFLPALMTAQTGPDRVNPLCGYEEEPKEKSTELIFGRLPKNHAHGSFPFMGGNGHAYNAVVKGYGAGLWDLWVDSAFDAKKKTQLALAPLPQLMVSIMVLIESISQVIRPLTLTVRLGANMTAGHVLLALCAIQAYVYVTLCAQWGGEIPPEDGH